MVLFYLEGLGWQEDNLSVFLAVEAVQASAQLRGVGTSACVGYQQRSKREINKCEQWA